jgi:DNA-directed RNA polymerase subunit omega
MRGSSRRLNDVVAPMQREIQNMSEKLVGIVSPSIDNLLSKPEIASKYELVIFASKRARQINDYYSALQDGHLFQVVGPLVDTTINEKPLTIALKEIDQNKLAKKTI